MGCMVFDRRGSRPTARAAVVLSALTGLAQLGLTAQPTGAAGQCSGVHPGQTWTTVQWPAFPGASQGQTGRTFSPGNGDNILPFAANPSVLLASDTRSVMRSTDGGCSWQVVLGLQPTAGTGLYDLDPAYGFGSLAISPQVRAPVAYATINDWSQGVEIGGGVPPPPKPPTYVAASRDGGASWSISSSALGYCRDTSVTIAPSDPDTAYLLCDQALYVTRDGARTFTLMTPPMSVQNNTNAGYKQVAVDPFNPRDVWTLGQQSCGKDAICALHTTDGKTWRSVNLPASTAIGGEQSSIAQFRPRRQSSSTVVVWAVGGLEISTNAGRTWFVAKVPPEIAAPVEDVAFTPDGKGLFVFVNYYVRCSTTNAVARFDTAHRRWGKVLPTPTTVPASTMTRLSAATVANTRGDAYYLLVNGTYYCSQWPPAILKLTSKG